MTKRENGKCVKEDNGEKSKGGSTSKGGHKKRKDEERTIKQKYKYRRKERQTGLKEMDKKESVEKKE